MYKFRDLAETCNDFAFDGNKRSVFSDFVFRNPPVTNVVVEPECYELFFDCEGRHFRGKGCDILVESVEFETESQMEVLEGFTQNDKGEWDLSSGVVLLDNGNECFHKVVVGSAIRDKDYFFLYYPDEEDFDLVKGSLMFQTLDETGEKEWGCFYTCEETNWFVALPGYDPSL